MVREQSRRLPPILGAMGFDGGSKRAIAFAIPKKEKKVKGSSDACFFSVECWTYAKSGLKCGYHLSGSDLRYAHAVTSWWGSKTIGYDTADCDNYHAMLGTDSDHPLSFTYDVDTRIGGTAPDCTNTCALSNDHGETDDDPGHDHTLLSGAIGDCTGGSPTTDPAFPAGPFDDTGTLFFVSTFDDEDSRTDWLLTVDGTPTHRTWTWDDVNSHANGDPGVLPRHECVDGSSNPVNWTTTVENTYDVLLSDEITTDELLTFVAGVLADDTHFTSHESDSSCIGCFNLAANEVTATYWSSLIRLTNTGTSTALFRWQVISRPPDPDEESPCAPDLAVDPVIDNGSSTLAPGGSVDIELYPDTAGDNVVMEVVNISCESV